MITAIPTLGGQIAPQSDSATEFTLVEGSGSDLSMRTVTLGNGLDAPAMAITLQTAGAQRFLAAGMSQELMNACEMSGIQVFYGATGSIPDALNLISLGILDSMANGGCGCGGGGCGGGSCDSASGETGTCGCGSQAGAGAGACGSGSCGCGN